MTLPKSVLLRFYNEIYKKEECIYLRQLWQILVYFFLAILLHVIKSVPFSTLLSSFRHFNCLLLRLSVI
jgi:hypothetical protein